VLIYEGYCHRLCIRNDAGQQFLGLGQRAAHVSVGSWAEAGARPDPGGFTPERSYVAARRAEMSYSPGSVKPNGIGDTDGRLDSEQLAARRNS
jgi:hypothetical protein